MPQSKEKSGKDEVLVLVKALPHAGKTAGETVCCAGVTRDRQWRRQYPIHFRRLDQQFKRWQWITYDWIKPRDDQRPESRRVQEETITLGDDMPRDERASFLASLVLGTTEEAASRGHTLTLIRPVEPKFSWRKKKDSEIAHERKAYQDAAKQLSFLDEELKALDPCPYAFTFDYKTADGKAHTATCDDWETTATFYRWAKEYGEERALAEMHRVFGEDYPKRGMVFAMGTHSRRPEQWLLVGVIRLDAVKQYSLI